MSESIGIPGNVTTLLQSWARGNPGALDEAVPQIYAELRKLAESQLRGRPANATLSCPALVNEAYIRLNRINPIYCNNRSQFFALASCIMRGILVDYYRSRSAQKRGGPAISVTLSDVMAKPGRESDPEVLDVDDALKGLALVNERQAQILEMRYFGGLSTEEIAEISGLSKAMVKREFVLARAWMLERLAKKPAAVRPSPGPD